MQWPMDATEHVLEEAPAANHRTIRLFQIDTVVAAKPLDDVPHRWLPCTTETVKTFSGVAYHFGEQLHRDLDIPVGIINTSWGAFKTTHNNDAGVGKRLIRATVLCCRISRSSVANGLLVLTLSLEW